MPNLIDVARIKTGKTANGAVTHETSLNYCLDYFAVAGSTRTMFDEAIVHTFNKAYAQNPDLAMKILLWARDCRGGSGERHGFHAIGKFLKNRYPELWDEVAIRIPEYGTWKDIFVIEETPTRNCIDWLSVQLEESPNANLLAKWYPRKGAWFTAMHKYKSMTPKEFRKYLVAKTNVVEHKICAKEWSQIDYKTVPSNAMNKYRNTFFQNDGERFGDYIGDVLAGKTKINASVLYPHNLFESWGKLNSYDNKTYGGFCDAIDAQWNALPNYMKDNTEKIIPVCDVSGSMHGLPMAVSVALGCYISERNEGIFKDAFISFSNDPVMQYLEGDSATSRFKQLEKSEWGFSTDLQAVFDLVIDKAEHFKISPDDMPTKILIISDMEFNEAAEDGNTNLEVVRERYNASIYDMPELIFWNVNGRRGNVPGLSSDEGVGLVSGFSPSILTSVLSGKVETPAQLMLRTVDIPRYEIKWDHLI